MLIALVGRAGSGKDTVATMIETESPRGEIWFSLSYATPMKHFCRDVFGFSDEQLYGPSASRDAPDPRYPRPGRECLSPREALQTLGTDWGRALFSDIWADLGARRAQAHLARGHNVVFTDCRFVNEAKAIRAMGGHVWRVLRPEVDATTGTHASEQEMDSPEMRGLLSMELDNSRTLEDLRALVRWSLAQVR